MKCTLYGAFGATLVLLAACGGGGDGGQNAFVRPTTSFDAQAAWKNLLTANRHAVLTGTATDGVKTLDVDADVVMAPGAAATFPPDGLPYPRGVVTSTLRLTGAPAITGTQENFYDANFRFVGSRNTLASNNAVSCTQATSASLPPTAVKIDIADKSGALYTANDLPDCSKKVISGTTTVTWSVEFEAGITYFCINSTDTDLKDPPTVDTESDCLQIAADGTLGAKTHITVTSEGLTIDARN